MLGGGVRVGVQRRGLNTQTLRGAVDPQCYFSPVCYQ